jgi:predicted amidophosphoribosyltransferase
MSVEVYDPFPGDKGILENCCICRESTEFWYQPKDVALCKNCAKSIDHDDIPTKLDWILKEELLDMF